MSENVSIYHRERLEREAALTALGLELEREAERQATHGDPDGTPRDGDTTSLGVAFRAWLTDLRTRAWAMTQREIGAEIEAHALSPAETLVALRHLAEDDRESRRAAAEIASGSERRTAA